MQPNHVAFGIKHQSHKAVWINGHFVAIELAPMHPL